MTISSTTRKAGPFIGNGSASSFPFTFKVFQASDLLVVQLDTTFDVESTLVLNTNYTVSLNANQNTNPGGTVTLSAGALAAGYTLTITSDIDNLQPTDLTNQGGFYPTVINDALDRATIQIQQLQVESDRSIKVPVSSTVGTDLPTPQANDLIGWNSDASALVNVDPGTLATVAAYATAYADTFTTDGSTVNWTLTRDPATINNLDVSIDGVTQVPNVDYTLSGTTFSTTSTVSAGRVILVKYREGLPNMSGDSQDFRYLPAGTGAVATTVQAKLRETVSVKDFGAVGDGVTDDWTAIQTAICYANTHNAKVYVPAGTYAHSKTLFFSCSDMALATASSNGENIFGAGTLFYTNTCIEGDGIGNTVFLYTGANHAVQVGEFSDSSYGYANKATFQSTFRDFTVESSGTPKKGIAASWIHYVYFEKIDVRGDYTEQNWFIDRGFSTINRPSLWNKFIEIEGRSYTADINFYLYGNSNQVQGFFAGGSDVVFDVVGSRNVHQVWAENSPTSGLSNAFIRAEGYNTFISPDLETGGGGVNYGFILNTGYTLISQPITVGISSSVIDPSSTGDYFIYPQLVAASTNPTNGRMQILSSKPIYGQYLPKWTYRAKETTGIPIDPVSFANITTLQSAGLAGDSYASGLVFHGIKLSDCTQNSTIIQIGAYVSDTLSWSSKTVTMNIGDTLYIDDKDLNFYFGQLDASVRVIVIRAKASSAGTVTANTITIEATNLLP